MNSGLKFIGIIENKNIKEKRIKKMVLISEVDEGLL
jgi:hypothetical protein